MCSQRKNSLTSPAIFFWPLGESYFLSVHIIHSSLHLLSCRRKELLRHSVKACTTPSIANDRLTDAAGNILSIGTERYACFHNLHFCRPIYRRKQYTLHTPCVSHPQIDTQVFLLSSERFAWTLFRTSLLPFLPSLLPQHTEHPVSRCRHHP